MEESFLAFLPIPCGVYKNFMEIKPSQLKERGIKVVFADLDNTLVAYGDSHPTKEVEDWKTALEKEGIILFILSNSRKAGRVDVFADALGVAFQAWSGKPKKKGYLKALHRLQVEPKEVVMVGDQIFTDILGATRMGILPIMVEPIKFSNFGQVLRYYILEAPFRGVGRKRRVL